MDPSEDKVHGNAEDPQAGNNPTAPPAHSSSTPPSSPSPFIEPHKKMDVNANTQDKNPLPSTPSCSPHSSSSPSSLHPPINAPEIKNKHDVNALNGDSTAPTSAQSSLLPSVDPLNLLASSSSEKKRKKRSNNKRHFKNKSPQSINCSSADVTSEEISSDEDLASPAKRMSAGGDEIAEEPKEKQATPPATAPAAPSASSTALAAAASPTTATAAASSPATAAASIPATVAASTSRSDELTKELERHRGEIAQLEVLIEERKKKKENLEKKKAELDTALEEAQTKVDDLQGRINDLADKGRLLHDEHTEIGKGIAASSELIEKSKEESSRLEKAKLEADKALEEIRKGDRESQEALAAATTAASEAAASVRDLRLSVERSDQECAALRERVESAKKLKKELEQSVSETAKALDALIDGAGEAARQRIKIFDEKQQELEKLQRKELVVVGNIKDALSAAAIRSAMMKHFPDASSHQPHIHNGVIYDGLYLIAHVSSNREANGLIQMMKENESVIHCKFLHSEDDVIAVEVMMKTSEAATTLINDNIFSMGRKVNWERPRLNPSVADNGSLSMRVTFPPNTSKDAYCTLLSHFAHHSPSFQELSSTGRVSFETEPELKRFVSTVHNWPLYGFPIRCQRMM